mmetsp:Transcript_43180/g.101506  ORF Transcript_43180/g.101506 Transcript_43180/m.101506 type:complete len:231 (-) Transcript_43180:575-1267(-)
MLISCNATTRLARPACKATEVKPTGCSLTSKLETASIAADCRFTSLWQAASDIWQTIGLTPASACALHDLLDIGIVALHCCNAEEDALAIVRARGRPTNITELLASPLGHKCSCHIGTAEVDEGVTAVILSRRWQVDKVIATCEALFFQRLQQVLLCDAWGDLMHHHCGDSLREHLPCMQAALLLHWGRIVAVASERCWCLRRLWRGHFVLLLRLQEVVQRRTWLPVAWG